MKVSTGSYLRHVNRHLGMQTKFLLVLAAILLCFSAFLASLIYSYGKNNLEEAAYRQTELVMAGIDSTREYVRTVLRPTMYSILGNDAFVLEAMSSSFISRQVMDLFKEKLPEFEYRRAAVNARNPDFEATELEIKMINFFKSNPQTQEWRGVVAKENGRYYMRFQPERPNPSCLHCHGTPDNVPQKIIEKYGVERGFHRSTDMVSGVVSIGIPVEVGLIKIKGLALSVFGAVFLAVFFLYGIISFFFNRLIIRNIRELLELFRDISKGDVDEKLTRRIETSDEIGELKVTAQLMAESLQLSRNKLKDYAENLEKKVADRTKELLDLNREIGNIVSERTRAEMVLRMAHEIRNPITIIGGLVRRLQKKAPGDTKEQGKIDSVLAQAQKLELLLSRFEELVNAKAEHFLCDDVVKLVNEATELVKAEAEERNVEILSAPRIKELAILHDARLIKVVIVHLLRNAINAHESGGAVKIITSTHHNWFELVLEDNGQGIPPEKLQHIFEPFISNGEIKTGLGLPYIKEIIKEHHGSIDIETQEGQGTRVTVRIPILLGEI